MATKGKRGPWSRKERSFIHANRDMTPDQIAARIQRDPKAVRKYMEKNGLINIKAIKDEATKTIHSEFNLKKSPHWNTIRQQFDEEEQKTFLYHWHNMVAQFKDDVLHTEELQIIDTIRTTILIDRALIHEKKVTDDISRLESLIEFETNKDDDDKDGSLITDLERQLGYARSALDATNKEFRELLQEKNKLLKEMKATREARIKFLESSKQSITGWMRQLLQRPSLRKELGIRMEKMRLAAEYEVERLSEWHKYEDGMIDQPLLTPETVKDDDE